jgi:choline dehydrogenase-like flavoprotein
MGDIKIKDLPTKFSSISMIFDKYCNVFGIHIFATNKTPIEKVRWAGNIMAEYLDNDGDGEVDNPLVLKGLLDVPMIWRPGDEPSEEEMEEWKDVKLQSAIYMSNDGNDQENMRRKLSELNERGDDNYIKQIEMNIHGGGQDLMATETGDDLKNENNKDMFDASLEEILHLITGNGYANAYPEIFGENKDSEIAKLMDTARGGYHEEIPEKYPDDAWYTYADKTCSYKCMITEYIYWGILTQLKVDWKNRMNGDLDNEWRIKKADGSLMTLQERDLDLYVLLTNKKYTIPTKLPTGNYKIKDDWYSKNYIESQYEKAYNLIYKTWKKNLDKNVLIEGRNILLDLYNRVNKDFKGSISIEYDTGSIYYKATPSSYGYSSYVAPTTIQTPVINTNIKKEKFNFDKSDIYTDIAYSYRADNIDIYKSEIVNYYEKSMYLKSDNWRTLQYYGIYHAQINNKEGAKVYMEKLKETIKQNGEINSKWDNVITDFQEYINKINDNTRNVDIKNDEIIFDINTGKKHFNYIIIGGGPSGIMCANRLSELKPESNILLIEKGNEKYEDYKRKGYNKLNNWMLPGYDPNYIESFESDNLDISGNKVTISIGQGLGGGTNHFGLQYIDQIDVLQKIGTKEFANSKWNNLIKDINKITQTRNYEYDDDFPLVLKDVKKTLMDNSNNGLNYTIHNNKIYSRDLQTRFSLASLLENKPNVKIMYGKTVDRINGTYSLINANPAPIGQKNKGTVNKLYFFNKEEEEYIDISKNTEVVLCAGAIFTPCILQRSGIGLEKDLKDSGSILREGHKLSLPVGKTLYDHGAVSLTYLHTDYFPQNRELTRSFTMPSRLNLIEQGWNDINNIKTNDIFYFAENINPNIKKTIITDISNIKKIIGNYSPIIYYGLTDNNNSSTFVEKICKDINASSCSHKYGKGKLLWDIVNNKTQDSGYAVLPTTQKKIIYQGMDTTNSENLEQHWKKIRIFNIIQYCNVYIDTQYLDRVNDDLLPSWMTNGMSYYFAYYWGDENELVSFKDELKNRFSNIKNVNLKNMETINKDFDYSACMWAIVYLTTLSNNNVQSLFRQMTKKAYNKNWRDLFNDLFKISYLDFYSNFKSFILNKNESLTTLNNLIDINKPLKELIGENVYIDTKPNITNLAAVNAKLLGHIQTRDYSNKWQTYYSLIPDQKSQNLLPLMVLTFAESGKIQNEGYVRIKSTNNEPPLVKTNFYENPESLNNIIEAFKINNKILEKTKFKCSVPSLLVDLVDISGHANIVKFFRKNLYSIYHYHGTCPIYGVVDINQKIYGINNCYIGDLSVLREPFSGSTSVAALCTGYRLANYLCFDKYRKRSIEKVINLSNYLGIKTIRNLYTTFNESDLKKKYIKGLSYSYVIRKYFYSNIYYESSDNKLSFSENESYNLKGETVGELFNDILETIKNNKKLEYDSEWNLFQKTTNGIEYSPEHTFMYLDEFQTDKISVLGKGDITKLYCKVSTDISGNTLLVKSNGVPNYKPSVGGQEIKGSWKDELSSSKDNNPNIIGNMDWVFNIPLIDVTKNPVKSMWEDLDNVTETHLDAIGVVANGIPLFNPWHSTHASYTSVTRDATTFATFSSCCGHPAGPRQGESGPGPYHYHKYPTCVAGNMGISPNKSLIKEHDMADVLDDRLNKTGKYGHSPLLGYMRDGYPVYGPLGTTSKNLNDDTKIKILKSSYNLQTITNTYSYEPGEGDLDKCNAIYSGTPEYPNGCYHYVLSILPDSNGKVLRTIQDLYVYPDGIKKPMITTSYPHTTIYYRGNPGKILTSKNLNNEKKFLIDINENAITYPISYNNNNNNLRVKLNKNKQYGIYCKENNALQIVNGILNVNLNNLDENCDIYIWEKLRTNKATRSINYLTTKYCNCNNVSLLDVRRNTRGPLRSYAGVKWMRKAEHEKLPHLVRSILGRAVWASNTLYYITTSEYKSWTDNELFLIRHAFYQYERVTNLKFIKTDDWDKADIEIKRKNKHPTNYNIVGSSYGPSYYGAEVIIYAGAYKSNNNSDNYPVGGYIGGWDYATFIHEIGHAVGLMHPHERVEGSIAMEGIEFDYQKNIFSKNNRANAFPFTVMSYNDVTSRYTPGWTLNYGYMSSLGPIDIAALQSVYGINVNYNKKDTIYNLPSASGTSIAWESIYDSSGIDTFDAQEATNDVTINLNPSNIGKSDGSGLNVSNQKNVWGGWTVASGVDIENAIGGAYNDFIYENKLSNIIDGKKGNDTVYTTDKNTNYLLIKVDNTTWKLINTANNNEENILKNIEYITYSNGITQNLKTHSNKETYPETASGLKISIKK